MRKWLKKRNYDLEELSKRYGEAQKRDYFGLELGKQTRDKLLAAGGGSSTSTFLLR